MGVMRILGKEGDVESRWDPNNAKSLQKALEKFTELHETRRMLAFETGSEGSTLVKEFNPNAQEIVFTPQFQGGL